MKFTSHYGYGEAEYAECKSIIDDTNEKTVRMLSWIALIITFVLSIIGEAFPTIRKYVVVYRVFHVIFVCFVVLLRYSSYLKRNILVQVYVLISIIIGFGASLAFPIPDEKAVVYPVLLVLIPILFTDDAKRMSKLLSFITVIYCIATIYYKERDTAIYDVFCSVCFGVIAILAHYICNIKFMRSILQEHRMELTLKAYKQVQEQLENKMKIDQLTGLYNRETFIEIVSKRLQCQEADKSKMVIGILDVDHFKLINDTFGHQMGDLAIIEVSRVLRRVLNTDTEVARLGGDEYIFVLNNISSKQDVDVIITKVLESLNGLSIIEGIKIEASIGLTFVSEEDTVFDTVYNKADRALYLAKKTGRNRYCYFGY